MDSLIHSTLSPTSMVVGAFLIAIVLWRFRSKPSVKDYFRGKRVIITGASEGIGRELGIQLASLGAYVVICARRKEKIEQVEKECIARLPVDAHGNTIGGVFATVCDVSSSEQCRELVEKSVSEFGELDLVIMNAAAVMWDMFVDLPDPCRDADIKTKTNYLANVYLSHYALPHLKRTEGQLVPITSLSGNMGTPMVTLYSASKHALQGFFDGLRVEFEMENIPVNICMLRLGMVSTDSSVKNTSSGYTMGYAGVPQTVTDMLQSVACRDDDSIISHPAWTIPIFQLINIFTPSLGRLIMKVIFRKAPQARREEVQRR